MILDGGAARGCFMGGVLAALNEAGYDAPYWRSFHGTSIGATSATYFVTGQIEQGLRFFTKHMPGDFTPKLGGVIPYFDQRYLEFAYRRSEDALDVEALKASQQKVWMTHSCPRTLSPKFVCLNNEPDPVLAMLKGTHTPMSIPFRQPGEEFFDGGFTAQPPINPKLLEGATEIWFLSSHVHGHRNSATKALLYRALGSILGLVNPGAGKLLQNMCARENEAHAAIEKMPNLKVIRPQKRLDMSWRCKRVPYIRATIEQGREAAWKFMKENNM